MIARGVIPLLTAVAIAAAAWLGIKDWGWGAQLNAAAKAMSLMLAAGALASIPLTAIRRPPLQKLVIIGLIATVIHLAVFLAGAATVLIGHFANPTMFAAWLGAFYFVSLGGLVAVLSRIIYAAAPPANPVTNLPC